MKDHFNDNSRPKESERAHFVMAAECGAIDAARYLFEHGDIDVETLECALSRAAAEGQAAFVTFLIKETGLDLSRCGPEALAQAVRTRETDVVEALTRRPGIALSAQSPMDKHYLDLALVGANPYSPELLELLLDRGALPVSGGFDAVNTALREENADALKRFVAHDASLKDSLGGKLVSAAMRLDAPCVRLLLEAGAPAGYADSAPLRGVTHQMLDIPNRDKERIFDCARLLLEADGGDDAAEKEMLKAAIRRQNGPLIHTLLSRGCDVEPEMRGIGYNRLVLAATYGFEDLLVQFHREGGVAPGAYEEALGAAAEHGHGRLVDRLIDWGVDASKTDVVFCAVVGGQLELVKNLVARGFTTDFKEPVLLEAVIEGDHGPMLDFLLDHGADRARAHEQYVRVSNRDSEPYASIHDTLKMWSERAMTVVYAIPEPHSLADLRAEEPDHRGVPQSLLVRMAKINRFGDALAVARSASNDRLEVDDLLKTDAAGNSVLEILGARNGLSSLFAPELWENRQEDFAALYKEVPPVYREQVNYQGLVSTWRRRALSNIKPLIPRIKGR